MDGNGIRAERVDDEEVVRLAAPLEREARIANRHHAFPAAGKESEVSLVPRDAFDSRIYFVEHPAIAGTRVGGEGTDAEAHDAD